MPEVAGSCSSQYCWRIGERVQEELDSRTKGAVLPPGTVLRTGGGRAFRFVFHAGFHRPDQWPDTPLPADQPPGVDSEQAGDGDSEYLHHIRICVREVLEQARGAKVRSIAFPLLGTGLFGLDARLLAYEFTRELIDFAVTSGRRLRDQEVWLVIRDEGALATLLEAIVQAAIDRFSATGAIDDLTLGIPYLDRFLAVQVRSLDPRWSTWMLLRYAELLIGFFVWTLAASRRPAETPFTLLPAGCPVTFGWLVRECAVLVERQGSRTGKWPRFIAALVRSDLAGARRMERLRRDRNALAHGKKARGFRAVADDLRAIADLPAWQRIRQRGAGPRLRSLEPWVVRPPTRAAGTAVHRVPYAVVELRHGRRLRYVVPETGDTFWRGR